MEYHSDISHENTNADKMVLKQHILFPKFFFTGRDKELDAVASMLSEQRVLFLQGMGGIGKSEIAKAYATRYKDRYDTVVFLPYTTSILDLVTSNALVIENLAEWDMKSESAQDCFFRKMDALRLICTERVLLILDNYDVDDDPFFEDFIQGSYHVLITSRYAHQEYPSLPIGPIQDSGKVRELFLQHLGKPQQKEDDISTIDEILRLVHYHTITVELLAKQMKASHIKPEEMLERLKSTGVNTQLKEKVRYVGAEKADDSFAFIRRLFQFAEMGEHHKVLLKYMTIVPYSGIDIRLFSDICGLESYDELNELIDHSWLTVSDDDTLSMHPVIADVVREELRPTQDNCSPYIRGLVREVGELGYESIQKWGITWPLHQSVLLRYPEPSPALFHEYVIMSYYAWFYGYDCYIEILHGFLECAQRYFQDDKYLIARIAVCLGDTYGESVDYLHADKYYEIGLQALKEVIDDNSSIYDRDQLADCYNKAGRCAYRLDDFERSKTYLSECLRIYEMEDMKVDFWWRKTPFSVDGSSQADDLLHAFPITFEHHTDLHIDFSPLLVEQESDQATSKYSNELLNTLEAHQGFLRFILQNGIQVPEVGLLKACGLSADLFDAYLGAIESAIREGCTSAAFSPLAPELLTMRLQEISKEIDGKGIYGLSEVLFSDMTLGNGSLLGLEDSTPCLHFLLQELDLDSQLFSVVENYPEIWNETQERELSRMILQTAAKGKEVLELSDSQYRRLKAICDSSDEDPSEAQENQFDGAFNENDTDCISASQAPEIRGYQFADKEADQVFSGNDTGLLISREASAVIIEQNTVGRASDAQEIHSADNVNLSSIYEMMKNMQSQIDRVEKGVIDSKPQMDRIEKNVTGITPQLDRIEQGVTNLNDFSKQLPKRIADELSSSKDEASLEHAAQKIVAYINRSIQSSPDTVRAESEKRLKEQFSSVWTRLRPETRSNLISARVLWTLSQDISEPQFNFNSIVLSATSALECELKSTFFSGFQRYMAEKYPPDTFQSEEIFDVWPEKLLSLTRKDYLRQFSEGTIASVNLAKDTTFTLGTLPNLFSDEKSDITKERMKEYLASIFKQAYEQDPISAVHVVRRKGHELDADCFIGRCEFIRTTYRNPAAHAAGIIPRDKAEECYNAILGESDDRHPNVILKLYRFLK